MISENTYYYCGSENNPLQFFINVFSIADLPFLFFEPSHLLYFEQFPQLKKLMDKSEDISLDANERAHIITTFYFVANKINAIEKKFWISDNNRNLAPTVNRETTEPIFKESTAYTPNTNGYIFRKLKEKFERQFLLKEKHKVSSKLFEANIENNIELQSEYVDNYSVTADYYSIVIQGKKLKYRFFIMRDKEIVLFFFKYEGCITVGNL